jgi:putative ABC transport system ATP-binding protein
MGLALKEIHFTYSPGLPEASAVFRGVSAVFPGSAIGLVTGENGSGKTTLLHLLAGLLRPTAGDIEADGRSVSRWTASHRDRWRRRVGIGFQHLRLIGDLTALENVMLPSLPRERSLRKLRERAMAALEKLECAGLAFRSAEGLSGGERQRVALARALAHHPRYLLVDEAFSHQDRKGAALIKAALVGMAEGGATVVASAHGCDLEWCHQAFRIRDQALEPLR